MWIMAFFGVNKEEEYDEDELEDTGGKKGTYQKRLIKNRDFKDLKKENRKKRKEPKKPWGRKERYFVLTLLILTAGVSAYLGLSSRSWKLSGLPKLTFPKLKLPAFLREETIVIEGSQEDNQKAEKVVNEFEKMTDSLSGVYGLYVIRLNNGSSYGVNEDEIFQAASLIKLPVMTGIYLEAEAGKLNLDEKYTLKSSDKIAGSGSLYAKPDGYRVTYGNLLRLMGKESDNTAFNISRNYLGDNKINEIMGNLGMNNTNLIENETTPKDIGNFFQDLWNGNILTAEDKETFLESLTDTIYEDYLPKGVSEEVRVAHKYGREVHVINDAGIIYSERPFVIVLMSKGIIDNEASEILPELSKMVYTIETEDN